MRRVGLFMMALVFCVCACGMSRIQRDFAPAQREEGLALMNQSGVDFSKLDGAIAYFTAKRFKDNNVFCSNLNQLKKAFQEVNAFLYLRMNDRETDPDVNSELIYLSLGYLTAIDEIKKDDAIKKKISELKKENRDGYSILFDE